MNKDSHLPAPAAVWGANRTPEKRAALFGGMKKRADGLVADPERTRHYEAGLVLVTAFSADAAEPIVFGPDVQSLVGNLVAAVGAIVDGVPYAELEKACGLTNYELRLCSTYDKHGFRPLYDWAGRERLRVRAERMEDILAKKAEEGIAKPVVVRRGRDHDEIEMVSVQSENLIAKATEMMRSSNGAQSGATNIGKQTIYNIQLPDYLLKERKPEKVIEAETVQTPQP